MHDCRKWNANTIPAIQTDIHDQNLIQHTLAKENEDPLMWSNPNNEMWSIPSAQMWNLQFTITSNGLLQLSIPLLEGESITVTGTFTIVVVLLMMNSNIPILCLSSGKLGKST